MAPAWAARVPATIPQAADAQRDTLRFTAIMLFSCLVLQRFGLPLGGKAFSLVGPVGLAVAGYFLLQGTLALDRFRLGCYLALAVCAVLGLAWNALSPGRFGEEPNLQSLSQFLLLTAFATLAFAEAMDERRFFHEVNRWFAIIAVAGLLQFMLQFVGIRIFAFSGILPAAILFEFGYNLQIGIGVGDLMKSNGFFLIEPSVFSQVMALGLIIEILAFRRLPYLALFVTGLLLSFSGTGWIVLASFVVAAGLGMGWRGIAIAGATVLVLGVLLGAGSYLVPDLAGALQQRMDEFSRPGTSGHRRFITPFWLLDDMLNATPTVTLFGLGAGVSERVITPYAYDVNTPIKIFLDYGLPALLAYVLLFVGGRKSPLQHAILAPVAAMFFIAGSYQQFAPVLFLVLLLIAVARLRPAGQDEPAAA